MARLANSLVKLRDQVNALYPDRSKASDGWLGNAEHASRVSDHNPNAQGVVTALDLTNDPAHGLNSQELAETVKTDSRVKYVISNGKIYLNGKWQTYTGTNPHNKHVHISVSATPSVYDNGSDWKLKTETGGNVATIATADSVGASFYGNLGRDATPADLSAWVGQPLINLLEAIWSGKEYGDYQAKVRKALATPTDKYEQVTVYRKA